MGVERMTRLTIAALLALAPTTFAFADPNPVGTAASGGQGNLHAGHMATVATGVNTEGGARYNTPSEEYHFGEGYRSGPGGWAETRKNEAAKKE
jgi:hypothetical protein